MNGPAESAEKYKLLRGVVLSQLFSLLVGTTFPVYWSFQFPPGLVERYVCIKLWTYYEKYLAEFARHRPLIGGLYCRIGNV